MIRLLVILAVAAAAEVYHFKREPITVEELRSAVQKSQNVSNFLPMHPFGALNWHANLGTTEELFDFALSTASVQTLVGKVGLEGAPPYAHRYDPRRSRTSKKIDDKFVYEHGQVKATGQTYEDTLSLFRFSYPTQFGAITNINGQSLFYDGQIGLAWKPYSTVTPGPTAPYIYSALNETEQKVYQFFNKLQMGSILMGNEGLIPCLRYVMHRLPVIEDAAVPMLSVNSFELNKYKYQTQHAAYLDSSVGVVLLPDAPFREVIKSYDARFNSDLGIYMVNCCCADREWQLNIGGYEFKVTDDQLIRNVSPQPANIRVQIRGGNGFCALMVGQSDKTDKQTYTLGMPFFYRHCVTFDVGKNQIGITKSVT